MSELSASQERFSALVNATSDVIYSMSPDWEIMHELDGRGFLSSTFEPTTGWREKNVHPLDMEMVNQTIERAIATKRIFELEHRVVREDGSTGWTFSRAVPILNEKGEIVEWFGTASDISLRKQTEQDLKVAKEEAEHQKRMYEAITSSTPDLVYVFGLDYRFTYANQALLDMWGKDWDSAIGNNLLENGYEPWHAEMHEREIDQIVITKKSVRGEVGFPHAILGKRVYDYILNPVINSNGDVVAIAGITRDVTDRKSEELEKLRLSDELAALNEEAAATNEELTATNEEMLAAKGLLDNALEKLILSETKLRYLISNAPVAIALLTGRGMIIDTANQKILEIWGKKANVIGKPLIEALPELIGQPFLQLLDEVFTTGVPYIGNEATTTLEGRQLYINFVYQPMLNEEGEVDSILVTATDVTEVVISRHKIEEAEIALRLAIEAANFGTWRIHSETREFITSNRLKEIFGFYPSDDITIGDAIAQITPDFRDHVTQKLENAITAGGNYDLTYSIIGFHDQVLRWVRAVGNLKQDPFGEFSAFTGVVMEITESYIATKKVERAEESLRMAIDAAELGSYSISVKDRIFMASPKLKEFFGFLPDDEVPHEVAIGQIHKDYRQTVGDAIEASITKGVRFDMEYPVVGFRDGKIRWLRGIGTVQQQNNGESYFTGVLHEITERKVDEMRKNDFIGMVSHELKTPLTSLNGYLQLMERKALKADDEFFLNSIDKALKQVKKMGSMINGFLTISRLESGKIVLDKTSFDLHELISETVEEMRNLESSHPITYDGHCEVKLIADKDKIGSVLSNLLSNAVKYSPSGSAIHVTCEVIGAGEIAKVSISDKGMGIKAADLENIFERYYRVQENINISGFGIGLYLSAEIIRRHNGRIWVESQLGSGSTFYFELGLSA
ncbi:PAS domain S-box protein [Pedobacter sp. Du54]|uniref:PAS domain-containing sensor histidine kinase n=1 Tax=Pedobacter anseongensis TaxID=3133439 RepID=UPI0030A7F87D